MPPAKRNDQARAASNRLFLKISGRRLRAYSIVKHVGRHSGREFANPASAYPLGDGFVIPILYGLDSQWVRNVLHAGRLTLVTYGREHALQRPEIISKTKALPAFPRWQQRTLKSRAVENFLWAHEHRTSTAIRSAPPLREEAAPPQRMMKGPESTRPSRLPIHRAGGLRQGPDRAA
jgi:hypothetical protein